MTTKTKLTTAQRIAERVDEQRAERRAEREAADAADIDRREVAESYRDTRTSAQKLAGRFQPEDDE